MFKLYYEDQAAYFEQLSTLPPEGPTGEFVGVLMVAASPAVARSIAEVLSMGRLRSRNGIAQVRSAAAAT